MSEPKTGAEVPAFYSLLGVSRQTYSHTYQRFWRTELSTPFWEFLRLETPTTGIDVEFAFYSLLGVSSPSPSACRTARHLCVLSTPFWEFLNNNSPAVPELNDESPPFYSLLGVSICATASSGGVQMKAFYSLLGVSGLPHNLPQLGVVELSTPFWEFLGMRLQQSFSHNYSFYSLLGVSWDGRSWIGSRTLISTTFYSLLGVSYD